MRESLIRGLTVFIHIFQVFYLLLFAPWSIIQNRQTLNLQQILNLQMDLRRAVGLSSVGTIDSRTSSAALIAFLCYLFNYAPGHINTHTHTHCTHRSTCTNTNRRKKPWTHTQHICVNLFILHQQIFANDALVFFSKMLCNTCDVYKWFIVIYYHFLLFGKK